MPDKFISCVRKVNSIAEEKIDDRRTNLGFGRQDKKSLAKSNLGYWLLGFGISCIPILSRQLGLAVIKSEKAVMWWNVLGSAEVAFLAIPLIITAVYYRVNRGCIDKFLKSFILLLVIGCLFYAIFSFSYEVTEDIDFMLISWFNIIFLGIVLIMGISRFIFDIKGL
ncbi:MAG: hypothetical protein FWD26_04525 [Treponema sp.]|nr:hypothetical protein [Treponema sp.]